MNQKPRLTFTPLSSKEKGLFVEAGMPPDWEGGEGVLTQHSGLGVRIEHGIVTDAEGNLLYDGIRIMERPGGLFLPITTGADGTPYIGLVRKDRIGGVGWEAPRGHGDEEDPTALATALREVREELGLSHVEDEVALGSITPNTARDGYEVGTFMGRVAINDGAPVPGDEGDADAVFCWFTRENLAEMVDRGEITCAMTLAAICQAMLKSIF